MSESFKINGSTLIIEQGDITKVKTDVIVNAANSSLMGGGGVDGAIHWAGGPVILEECKEIIKNIGNLKTGNAVITTAGNLPSKFVVHTVGPIWHGGDRNESELLKNCYKNSLELADGNNLKTIAFPSISTGAYRYPLEQAAKIAIETVCDYLKSDTELTEVRFILFDERSYEAYLEALEKLSSSQ